MWSKTTIIFLVWILLWIWNPKSISSFFLLFILDSFNLIIKDDDKRMMIIKNQGMMMMGWSFLLMLFFPVSFITYLTLKLWKNISYKVIHFIQVKVFLFYWLIHPTSTSNSHPSTWTSSQTDVFLKCLVFSKYFFIWFYSQKNFSLKKEKIFCWWKSHKKKKFLFFHFTCYHMT